MAQGKTLVTIDLVQVRMLLSTTVRIGVVQDDVTGRMNRTTACRSSRASETEGRS